jgi:hypothetical protein
LIERYECDIETIKIFAHTLNNYCLRFCNNQTKSTSNHEFLKDHEDRLRFEFVLKIEEKLQKTISDALFKFAKGEHKKESDSEDEYQHLEPHQLFFIRMLEDIQTIIQEYISLFENKAFWNDIVINHRKTIWEKQQSN